jgi:hypothetical protein
MRFRPIIVAAAVPAAAGLLLTTAGCGSSATPPVSIHGTGRKRLWTGSWTDVGERCTVPHAACSFRSQLQRGSWRAKVYAGRTR